MLTFEQLAPRMAALIAVLAVPCVLGVSGRQTHLTIHDRGPTKRSAETSVRVFGRQERLDDASADLYIVHVKRITASEARRNWFRLLDEVARGEKFVIERRGRRIIVLCEEMGRARSSKKHPSYAALLQVPDADRADRWSWKWTETGLELRESS